MRHNEEAHISSFLIMQAPRNYLPEAIENSPSGASISLSMEMRDHLLGGLVADLVPFHFSGPISLCEKTTSGCLMPPCKPRAKSNRHRYFDEIGFIRRGWCDAGTDSDESYRFAAWLKLFNPRRLDGDDNVYAFLNRP